MLDRRDALPNMVSVAAGRESQLVLRSAFKSWTLEQAGISWAAGAAVEKAYIRSDLCRR